MLTPPTADEAARLRRYFSDNGYTEAGLSEALGGRRPTTPDPANMFRLQWSLRDAPRFRLLVNWFYFGEPQARTDAAEQMPQDMLDLLQRCGVLAPEDGHYRPSALIFPFEDYWIAADFYPDQGRGSAPDSVMGVNPTALHLLNITLREPVDSTLDLGTGCGIQALYAATHSRTVTATDINPRALAITAFNAALNGLPQIECLEGDCFAPVAGRRFDLIVSNPPFFMTPSRKILFVDNDMELDGFCRRLVREGPAHLNEGGCFQMTCEWAQVDGQPWQERLAEWVRGIGCDAWVLKANTQLPENYAETRLRESPGAAGPAEYAELLDYYRGKKLVAIHGGFILLRRRRGDNWLAFDELQAAVTAPIGQALRQGLAARDFLGGHDDDRLMSHALRLSPDVLLQQDSTRQEGAWRSREIRLQLNSPLPQVIGMEQELADFLAGFDGATPTGELVADFGRRLNADRQRLVERLLPLLRTLVEKRILLP